MRILFKLLGLSLTFTFTFGAALAQAQGQVQKMTPQQEKTALCEKAAAGKKGDDRKSFLTSCMAASSAAQPSKVVACDHANRAEDL